MKKRVFLIVLDSFGVGALPDAADYGDAGSDTLAACVRAGARLPNLQKLGLGNIEGVTALPDLPEGEITGAFMRMAEQSKGKDTTTGHWEIAGVISPKPMPTYPNGFPPEIIKAFEQKTGRKALCNRPYSGLDVIRDYGEEQVKTGGVIVYTSADSVFQVAAHESVIPVAELYDICQKARDLLCGEHAVGRVIARPFTGAHPFTRTTNRHDFSLQPPRETMLDILKNAGKDVVALGKISDIFAGCGVTEKILTTGNTDGLKKTTEQIARGFNGLCFVNLVDFDMLYGHRNDPKGYADALEEFDAWLGRSLPLFGDGDLLMLTADHGCDPSTASTDHSREYVPLLVWGKGVRPQNLGTRKSFSDIAATVLQALGVAGKNDGEGFYHILTEG